MIHDVQIHTRKRHVDTYNKEKKIHTTNRHAYMTYIAMCCAVLFHVQLLDQIYTVLELFIGA